MHILKKEKELKSVTFHLKQLEKEEQDEPKASRRYECKWLEWEKMKQRKITEKDQWTPKLVLLKKNNKIYKFLARLLPVSNRKLTLNQEQKRELTEIMIVRECYEEKYANK